MSKKRIPTLSDIVSDETSRFVLEEKTVSVTSERQEPASAQRPASSLSGMTKMNQDDKKGRASTTVYLPQEVKRQLEEIWFAERQNKSQNDLFLEGLDLVFKQRGMPSVKELVKEEA